MALPDFEIYIDGTGRIVVVNRGDIWAVQLLCNNLIPTTIVPRPDVIEMLQTFGSRAAEAFTLRRGRLRLRKKGEFVEELIVLALRFIRECPEPRIGMKMIAAYFAIMLPAKFGVDVERKEIVRALEAVVDRFDYHVLKELLDSYIKMSRFAKDYVIVSVV